MVKVLVGKREGGKFPGFWAEFDGEEASSYEDSSYAAYNGSNVVLACVSLSSSVNMVR